VPVLVPLPALLVPFYRHCENGASHPSTTPIRCPQTVDLYPTTNQTTPQQNQTTGYHEASLKLSLLAARRIDASLREETEDDADDEDDDVHGAAGAGAGAGAGAAGTATGYSSLTASAPAPASFFPGSPTTSSTISTSISRASSAHTPGTSGGPGRGMGRRRRSTTTINGTPAPMEARGGATGSSSLEAALLVHEPPIVVDYFEMSAYAQPSLTEGPQEAENLPLPRSSASSNPRNGEEELPLNCAMAPSTTSVTPRPLSLSASAHAALAKRLGKRDPDLVEDLVDGAALKAQPPAKPATALRPSGLLGGPADAEGRRSLGGGNGNGNGNSSNNTNNGRASGGASSGAGADQRV
jgi:hypothetical protein